MPGDGGPPIVDGRAFRSFVTAVRARAMLRRPTTDVQKGGPSREILEAKLMTPAQPKTASSTSTPAAPPVAKSKTQYDPGTSRS